MGCNHLWNVNDGKGGQARFEVRTAGGDPVMRASCSKCYSRAWFTEKQWAEIKLPGYQRGGVIWRKK